MARRPFRNGPPRGSRSSFAALRWQRVGRFQLIDEDDRALLWESGALEPWAPLELCSVALTQGPRHLCLRVQSRWPPEGALWIDPQVALRRSGRPLGGRWEEVLGGELFLELVARLACRDVARLLTAYRCSPSTQQAAWHCAFWHGFRPAYLRPFHLVHAASRQVFRAFAEAIRGHPMGGRRASEWSLEPPGRHATTPAGRRAEAQSALRPLGS